MNKEWFILFQQIATILKLKMKTCIKRYTEMNNVAC